MNHHDYMACQLAACQLCQGYEDGYSAGQATRSSSRTTRLRRRPRGRLSGARRGRNQVGRRATCEHRLAAASGAQRGGLDWQCISG